MASRSSKTFRLKCRRLELGGAGGVCVCVCVCVCVRVRAISASVRFVAVFGGENLIRTPGSPSSLKGKQPLQPSDGVV